MNNQELQERFLQLESSINDFYRLAYNPENNGWDKLDAKIRTIEEMICVILVYAVFDRSNPEEKLVDTNNGKLLYGKNLIKSIKQTFDINGIDSTILESLERDISKHNDNCHGSNIPTAERKAKGRMNVLASLPVLIELFQSELYSFPYLSSNKDTIKRLGTFLSYSHNLLQQPEIDVNAKAILDKYLPIDIHQSSSLAGQYHFCLLLPDNPSKELIDNLRPLANIRWSMVIDKGSESGEAYKMWCETNSSSINNTGRSEKLDANLINWYFIDGVRGGLDKSNLRLIHNKLIKKPLPLKECIIIDLLLDKSSSYKSIKKLWEMFIAPDDYESSVLSHILSINTNTSENQLEKRLHDNDYQVASFSSIPMDGAKFIATAIRMGVFPSPNVFSDVFAIADQETYHNAGIRFLDSEDNSEQISQWDKFYGGRIITTEELRQNADVHPRCAGNKDKRFEKFISDSYSEPNSREFTIVHQPGAGGSTVARRIAYNLFNEDKWLPIFITELKPSMTIDMMKRISESIGGVKRLLIITDDKYINANQYTDLRNRLKQSSIFPIYLRIRHEFSLDNSRNDSDILRVYANLTSTQIVGDFDTKFGTYFSKFLSLTETRQVIDRIHDLNQADGKTPEMINYPYAFCERLSNKGKSYILLNKNNYVEKWFNEIDSPQLRDVCGFVALIYRFSASRPTDIYGLISRWKSLDTPTLKSYPKKDLEAMYHLLKRSSEGSLPGEISNLLAPRYGSFAEGILSVWKIGWKNNLSDIVVDFINAYNSELNPKEEDLFFDVFTQQSRINKGVANTGDSSIPFNDRFSLLIGFILNSKEEIAGVKKIFNALIEKYPNNAFYKLHYGRILFEYAHMKQYDYNDKLFEEAEKLVTNALSMREQSDDCNHVVGMYWSRYAAALARDINKYDKNGINELETSLKEAIDKACECFEKCNQLNSGTSPYGYFSTANLMIRSLDWYKRIFEIKNPESIYFDLEPCLTFLDILGECTSELTRFSSDEDEREGLDFERIQTKYLELLGDKEKALDRAKEKYLSASDKTKVLFGHQFMTLCLTRNSRDVSQRSIYRNIEPERRNFLQTMLARMTDMGDLRAAENLFNLNRYLNNDSLCESKTTLALEKWYALAIEKKDTRHILKSAFYLYTCYAAQLITLKSPDTSLSKKYLDRRAECRKITESLDEDPHRTWAFLGNEETDKWTCILDATEAVKYDKDTRSRFYYPICRRVDARMTGINGRQGDCECGELTMISFRRGNIPEYEVGKLILKNGIVGFRYNGVGLYKFNDKYNSDGRTDNERAIPARQSTKTGDDLSTSSNSTTSKQPEESKRKIKERPTETIFKTETERKGLISLKRLGTIDLKKFENTSRFPKPRNPKKK